MRCSFGRCIGWECVCKRLHHEELHQTWRPENSVEAARGVEGSFVVVVDLERIFLIGVVFAFLRDEEATHLVLQQGTQQQRWSGWFFFSKKSTPSSSAGDEHARARTSFARDVNELRHGRDASDTDDCHTRKKGSCAKGDIQHRTATSDFNEV